VHRGGCAGGRETGAGMGEQEGDLAGGSRAGSRKKGVRVVEGKED